MSEPLAVPGAVSSALPADCETQILGVAFFDLSRMAEWSSSDDDTRIATFLQAFYQLASQRLEPAGVRIVKLMGDAGLAVFPKESAEEAIFALAALADEVRAHAVECGIDAYLNVNVHVGSVLAGSFGPPGQERFDVIGKVVNIAARLGRRGLTLSEQAFRCLSPEGRQRFQKIVLPTTYRLRP
jgi:class 3 adenylate cyclase